MDDVGAKALGKEKRPHNLNLMRSRHNRSDLRSYVNPNWGRHAIERSWILSQTCVDPRLRTSASMWRREVRRM